MRTAANKNTNRRTTVSSKTLHEGTTGGKLSIQKQANRETGFCLIKYLWPRLDRKDTVLTMGWGGGGGGFWGGGGFFFFCFSHLPLIEGKRK